ncbi:hypothetical protein VNO77_22050 [Canavalia gladiata]|uniref:Uncharacterized protein n=1 Tax=Canavalia gladiata TaxID=3824 RepID=A0AAN9L220_CANGL
MLLSQTCWVASIKVLGLMMDLSALNPAQIIVLGSAFCVMLSLHFTSHHTAIVLASLRLEESERAKGYHHYHPFGSPLCSCFLCGYLNISISRNIMPDEIKASFYSAESLCSEASSILDMAVFAIWNVAGLL